MDLECGVHSPKSVNIGGPKRDFENAPKSDVMVLEKTRTIKVAGLEVEITETTRLNPPTSHVAAKTALVSPNTKKKVKLELVEDKLEREDPVIYRDCENDNSENLRKKR